MLPNKRYESATLPSLPVKSFFASPHNVEDLRVVLFQGDHQSTSDSQLFQQGLGDLRGSGGDQNSVKGGFFLPPQGAVSASGVDVSLKCLSA